MYGILFFLLLIVSYNAYGWYKEHCLFNRVARINSNLFDELISVADLESVYYIRLDERKYIMEILSAFKSDIVSMYFEKKLDTNLKILSLNERDYLFYYLYQYMKQHEDDYYFASSEYQLYNSKKELSLSPFGITYKKIQLIAAYCCNQSQSILKIEPQFAYYYSQEKEYFDTYILND